MAAVLSDPRPCDCDAASPLGNLPLSYGQRALWLLERLAPGSGAYVLAGALRVRGPLDVAALRTAFFTLTDRHPALRASFGAGESEPVQRILARRPPTFVVEEAAGWDEAAVAARLAELAFRPFDLERDPLLRVAVLQLGPSEHRLVVALHHLVADFWSLGVILRELSALYQAPETPLPPLRATPGDHVRRLEDRLAGPDGERLWEFWRRELAGRRLVLDLPTDRLRPPLQTFRGDSLTFHLEPAGTESLHALAREGRTTLFSVLLAAFQVLLHRYTGEEEILVGSPTTGRSSARFAGVVGYFVNPVALRGDLAGDPAFADLLGRVRQTVQDALAHRAFPFPLLAERLAPERDPSRSPVFQAMLAFEQERGEREQGLAALAVGEPGVPFALGGLDAQTLHLPAGGAQVDLTLFAAVVRGRLALALHWNPDLWDRTTAARMAGHLATLLAGLAADPGRRLSDLPLLSAPERRQLAAEWNDTAAAHGPGEAEPLLVHERVAAVARQRPDAAALVASGSVLTYGELARRAERLAHRLRELGVGPGVRVALSAGLTPRRVVAILAVLAAGGAYVPLDPDTPPERLAFLLEDSQSAVLLSEEGTAERLGAAIAPPTAAPTREDLAYVVYTSGSTGVPKGVAIPHSGLLNLVDWHLERYGVGPEDRGTQLANPAFDASVWELWPYLAVGASVHFPDLETRLSPRALLAWWAREGITHSFLPTPLAESVLAEAAAISAGAAVPGLALRALLCGGDRLRHGPAAGLPFPLINHYGPSESSVVATFAPIPEGMPQPPIGRPIANTRAFVLDRHGALVPAGVVGELGLGGAGLARGYLDRPELTAERFVPDPFAAAPGGRLYRTGDLVRRRADGSLDFVGRIDHQVKIRGVRMELGEIESVLRGLPAVREGVVLVREDRPGERRLVAYVVPGTEPGPTAGELRDALRRKLPEPMVPAAFVFLGALPVTANGKLDRRALPAPAERREPGAAHLAPRSAAERRIAALWQEVLGVERVGLDDNFFDLGGHSLLLPQVHARLAGEVDFPPSLVDLLRFPTVRTLAAHVSRPAGMAVSEIPGSARATARATALASGRPLIAIVGMAGRFPDAPSPRELWQNLCAGVESIRFFSAEELREAGVPAELLAHPGYVRARGFLDGVDLFDASFFGYSPGEAATIDPQQRIFLECAWEALEDAGYDPERFPGAIGLYAGAGISQYMVRLLARPDLGGVADELSVLIGNDKDFLPTRVSYKLNLRGPSVNVQTACSTSLVAVHMAAESLVLGECDMALAGGVSIAPTKSGYLYREGSILSPDGHCRAFDARGRGTVVGSGAGIVVLKRLDRALADGDSIYAVLRGSAINNDGAAKVGFTAPSVSGQAAVIAEAQAVAGVLPGSIGYVEAHGTGTSLGDPIEIAALSQVLSQSGESRFCAVGSIKTNLGHMDAAAGVAGLMKAALMLRHGKIPPSLNFTEPNPQIDFASGPVYVNTELRDWPAGDSPRRAGVSSFGLGGTNAHVVLEEAPPAPAAPAAPVALPAAEPQLLVLSARSAAALERATDALARHLGDHPALDLADVAHTLQVGRRSFEHRRALVGRSTADAAAALLGRDPGRLLTQAAEVRERPVVFLLPGQGAQHVDMGLDLYRAEPLFRQHVDRCSELLLPRLGYDLRTVLYPALHPGMTVAEAARRLDRPDVSHPALFVVETALALLWSERGITPGALLGYSFGECVAAHLAGVFTLEDALGLVVDRAALLAGLPPGSMLAVPLPEEELLPLLGDGLSLAAVNGPAVSIASGEPERIAALARELLDRGVLCQPVPLSYAAHSLMLDPLLSPLAERVAQIPLAAPRIPYIANSTGTWVTADQATDPCFWARHLREPVRFAAGVRTALADPDAILLEVGPGRTLSTLARLEEGAGGRTIVASMRQGDLPAAAGNRLLRAGRFLAALRESREETDREALLSAQGRLWLAGLPVDWRESRGGRRVSLPTYPFERRRHWLLDGAAAFPSPAAAALPAGANENETGIAAGPPPAAGGHSRPALATPYQAPENPLEEQLAALWEELLGLRGIGVHDHFYDLGGHSLLATQVISRVRERFAVAVTLEDFFAAPTIAAFAAALETALPAREPLQALRPAVRPPEIPLSYAQERLWFLDQLDRGSTAYNQPAPVRLSGRLRPAVLAAALGEVVRRHEVLRTSFPLLAGRPVQAISPAAAGGSGGSFPLPLVDLADLPPSARQAESARLTLSNAALPFDLARGPVIRTTLLRFTADEHTLLLTLHHIATDGWSLNVLAGEVAALYEAFAAGRPSPLPELPVQYADFTLWQRGWLTGEVLAAQLAWWRERLAGAPQLLALPGDRPRPAVRSGRGGEVPLAVPAALRSALNDLAGARRATLFMALLAGWSALLGRATGQDDLLVGSPIANRTRLETEGLIGFFVNTLVLRAELGGVSSFAGLLSRMRETALAAYDHQELPFEKLVEDLATERSTGVPPLVQVLLALEDRERERTEIPGLSLALLRPETGTAKLDLSCELREAGEELLGRLEYSRDLFDAATIERLGGHFLALLTAAVRSPEEDLRSLPLLTPPEREQLVLWNATAAAFPEAGATLPELLAAQAARTPDATAVVFAESALSYGELATRALLLARELRRLGVGPDVPVGICLDRSLELLAGLVAILAAGGAYVPLDPGQPAARLTRMLEDARPPVILAEERTAALLPAHPDRRVVLVPARPANIGDIGAIPDGPPAGPENLAYVIFTSGSTGRPKGVMNSHRAIVNRLLWGRESQAITAADRFLQKTPVSFDVSVWEIFLPLLTGACLVVARPGGHQDPAYLAETLAREAITVAHFVPAMLQAFLGEPASGRASALRLVVASGEALPPALAERFFDRLPAVRLENLYGPTEAAVEVTAWPCLPGQPVVPIGRPVANTRIRLLDPYGEEVPVGVCGELHIGGVQLGRGYLGRPDLTAERFVPEAFGAPGSRLYRTGDLARRLRGGEIEYLGRIDSQVKIRGVRIEPGEIEAALAAHPGVAAAAVLVRESAPGEKSLVACFVAAPAGDAKDLAALPSEDELRDHLASRLPGAMVPAAFVPLPALPLTAHGKVDGRALEQAIDGRDLRRGPRTAAVPPRTPVERRLAGIWGEVLPESPEISVEDNFFALGGHSLLATRAISRVNEVFGLSLPVRALFEAPTIAALARLVPTEKAEVGEDGVPAPRPRGPRSLLSHAQERLWFLDRLEPGSPLYNIAAHVALAGRLDLPALRQALAEIVRRHEALRTRFVFVDGQPLQETLPACDPGLPVADLECLAPAARAAEAERLAREEARRPFDLATGPLQRSTLLRLAPAEHRVLFTQHHIVSDGWSMGVFVHELAALYGAFAAGRPSPLPELPLQYPDFALWQREYLEGGVLAEQLTYWRERLLGAPVLELPTDRPRPAVPRNRGGLLSVALPPTLSRTLPAFARERSATPFMVLLAAWAALLGRLSGQDDLVVGSPVANRTRRELEGLIGFFVNTLALRAALADAGGAPGFGGLVARVRETALAAYAHQDLPFERLVEEVAPERSLSRSPLFQVMFALQNAPMGDLALPGLDLTVLPVDVGVAKFDLTLVLFEGPEGFAGTLEHDRDLFDRTTVQRLAGHLTRLLSGALTRPGLPLAQLPLLAAAEEAQLVREWNDTHTGSASEMPEARVDQQVAAWARRQPDVLAIVSEGEALSYGELDRRAGRLARHLRARGMGPEVRVAVSLTPGPAWAIALLGVLKAGGAYVALDPGYPEERRAYVLADSGAPVVLTGLDALPDLPAGEDLPAPGLPPASLAYVIYTSGSTGRPKGVLLSHTGLANLVRWHGEAFSPAPGDRATQVASPAFDASVLELWPCLAAGATLVTAPWEARLDPEAMLRFWAREGITLAFLPTPLTEAVLEQLEEGRSPAPRSLRALTTGGDRLHHGPSPRLPFRLANLYGPTESTVVATCAALPAGGEDSTGLPPIGRPLPGTRALVLDRAGHPLPLGAAGELHLGGRSLARGYHGRPDLTAERFVPDPHGEGDRLYRTGDLVRHLPDGSLDFLGRLDHQVKIRGFRIELGEIEAALAGHPAVAEAAVLAVGEERKRRLAAFAVPRPGAAVTAAGLRRALAQGLPDYMVPSLLTILPALPTTANGKVDRAELARRALAARATPATPATPAEDLQEPRTPTEELVLGAFREILGRERFGVDESFFELGGHSLMATRVVARLESTLGVELPLRLLFESPTVAGLAREIDSLADAADPAAPPPPPIARVPRDRPLPLSYAQERLWFLDRLQPGSPVYNIPAVLRLKGHLDLPALCGSLDEIVRRHEALRTTFAELPGGAVQVIAPRLAIPVPQVDLGGLPPERRAALAESLAREGARQPFDLGRGPLLRALLVSLGTSEPGEHLLLLSIHHIVADGWSMGVLVREFTALYEAAVSGRPSPLPELPFQYADFATWQRQWLEGGALERQLAWWWEALAGAPTLLDLPGDRPRPPVASGRGGAAPLRLSAALAEALQTLARKRGATLHMTLFAGLSTLLSRLSGQPDLLVGTPVANRTRLPIEALIGFFVNTLALRADLSGNPAFPELLSRVRAMALGAYARQDLPFERLVEALQPDRATDAPPVFQVLFVLQNAPLGTLALPGLSLTPLEVGTATAKFDLTLSLVPRGGALEGSLEYNRDLFDATTAARFAGQLETLFREIAADPERRVTELPILQPAERQAVLREWNAAPRELADPAADLTAPIRERAAEEGDRAAVSCHGAVLTYGELVRRARQLARHLVRMGIPADTILGICLDRTLDMAVAVLAALEAGIAYLPLDPAYPPERLALMLDDCDPQVILTQAALLPDLAALLASRPAPPRLLCLDTERAAWTAESAAPLPPRAQPANLIYMVYTSGSTGRPKGIAMMRQALANLLAWQEGGTSLGARARTLQFALLSFDVSFQEFISTWRRGGTVVLLAEETRRDAFALLSLLARERIERLYLPYIVLRQLAEVALERRDGLETGLALADVITAGEQLQVTPSLLDWFATLPAGCRLHNQYGPSEGHVVTAVTFGADPADRGAWPPLPPVGRTIANLRAYLMDSELGPLPAGIPGEVGVAGIALARGYLGRPELTAEKFVPDPFCDAPGERLYKTGDLARFRADGQVEYLGRLDGQVKIRGFRIELGEVEAVLAQHPEVRGVAVVARDEAVTGARRLVAYLVCDAARLPAVREWLKGRLPDYMVPSAFVPLDALPLHPSGKLNRRALPAVQVTAPVPAGSTGSALSPVEELLAGIWTDLLELDPAFRPRPDSDFFALGGHSLLATRVVSRVRAAFGVDLPLRSLFETSTLAGMAQAIAAGRDAATGGEPLSAPPIRPLPAGPEFPLSFAQERLWFLDQLAPGGATYNMPGALRLRGRLDVPALGATLAGLAARHETLRTTFALRGGAPVQAIAPALPELAPHLPLVDLGPLPERVRESEVRRLAAGEVGRPFDLGRGPLLRTALLRLGHEEHVALFTLHHIISDGWSMGVFVREVAALYRAAVLGVPAELPPLPVQYRDYAVWQREQLSGERLAAELAWWRATLSGAPALLELPLDRPRPSVQRFRGARRIVHLPRELAGSVTALCRQAGATPFMTLLAVFQTLLSRLSGQADLAVGSPIAGRSQREVEGLIGFFVNTLVLRVGLADRPPFRRLLDRVREVTLGAYAHQDLPFDRLVEELRPERDLAYAPLFQVMFALQNAPMGALALPGLELEPVELEVGAAKFDLVLSLGETARGLEGGLGFNRDLFDPTTAERIAGCFRTLLEAAVAAPERPVDELPLLAAPEWHQLLKEWRGETRDYPGSDLLHELFEAQAARTPAEPAVWCAGTWMSYGELDERAGSVAERLRGMGVGPEGIVGVCLTRSFDLVAGLIGILKAGAAYVPLDPGLPAERLAYLVEDSGAGAVLVEEATADLLPAGGVPRVFLGGGAPLLASPQSQPSPSPGGGTRPPSPPLAERISPDHPAYVIYTSGSTGRPKGVMIPHRAISARLRFACADDLHPGERMIQKTTLSFDVSVFEVFAPLLTGGRLILPRQGGEKDPAYLLSLAAEHGVTRLSFPPALLTLLLEQEALPSLRALRMVVTGGETVPPELPGRFYSRMAAHLENRYGPTEATISVTAWRCPRGEAPGRLPIGRPIAVSEIYFLDASFQPVPPGVAGELTIGGVCLARGYLGRPELTAAVFVPHPFAELPGERLYRTGDVARQRADGAIDFLGRIDGQVKVRGFRVELGEIEAALRELPDLKEVAVADREDPATGSRRLVAWLVPKPGAEVRPAAVRELLQGKIPTYMVPSAFVVLPALPLTPSGKVDRQALPEPQAGPAETAAEGPRGPLEELLAGIWADLLGIGIERIGRDSSFFELGGHSLLATRAVSRLREALGVELPLRRLFEEPTLAGLAAAVAEAQARGDRPPAPPLRPVPRDGRPLPLSFAQERLWFLEQLEPGGASYAMPAAVRFHGRLDAPALEAALAAIVRRHAVLRTVFRSQEGRPEQVILPDLPVTPVLLPTADLAALPEPVREAELLRLASASARRPFDLAAGPLFRAARVRLAEAENAVLCSMHHIVSDGWSVGIFVRELAAFYTSAVAGEPPALPPLPVQYADFAVWQRGWLAGPVLAAEVDGWRERLDGAPALLELPTDRPRPALPRYRGAQLPLRLSADLSTRLERRGRRSGATPFMLLLAGFAAVLSRWSGQDDLVIGSPVANRTQREVEGLLGFFVNTLALRARLAGAPAFSGLLGRVRETTLLAYAHQDLPFEKLVEALAPERSLAHAPIFQVLLILQNTGMGGGSLDLPGLTLTPIAADSGTAKLDLTLSLGATAEGFAGGWEYDRDLFDPATVERLAAHLERLLGALADGAEGPVGELPLLSAAELAQLAEWSGWRGGPEPEIPAVGVHDLFFAQAARTPEAEALVVGEERLTYAELAARVERLAGVLRARGVGPEERVGIALDRTAALPVALLAVLAAGGAYVPMDPAFPRERLRLMLEDSGARLLLTQEDLLERLPDAGIERLLLDPSGCAVGNAYAGPPPTCPPPIPAHHPAQGGGTLRREVFATGRRDALAVVEKERILVEAGRLYLPCFSDASYRVPPPWAGWRAGMGGGQVGGAPGTPDLAYIIYTSGSTGRPKGVAVRHAGVVNFLASMAAEPGLSAADTLLAVTTVSFDIAGLELYLPLTVGARVVLASREEAADGGLLAAALARSEATVLQATPATWRLLLAGGWPGDPRLRAFCGGEALPRELAAELRGKVAELWNLYGPTETTIWSTVERVGEGESPAGAVPIGQPIAHTSARVLDRSLGAVPVGVAGELYLGGAGVARGYHGRPDLTAERFLPDPFAAEPGARCYRTGDVVRHLSSGALAYLGRADYQVKVRGFRIELGEIEAVLASHPRVRQALVVAREDHPGDRRLVAYVVPREEEEKAGDLPAALRAHTAERLPAYLVPAAVVVLAAFPLTPNGKVDRKALPAPEWQSGTAFVAPRNPLEEVLAGIWCEVLGVGKAGVHDNFFRSGGHSLLATQLIARVKKAFQVDLPLRRLFETPTIEALALAVEAAEAKPGQSRKIARVLQKARELARERAG